MVRKEPVPEIVTAAGNVNHRYQSLGIVIAVISKSASGCSGGLPVGQAMSEATDQLKRSATARGANGLIHVSYMHRVSTSPGCGGATANIEVYAWGTAVLLQ